MKNQPNLVILYHKKSRNTYQNWSDSDSICSIESPLIKSQTTQNSPFKDSDTVGMILDDSLLPLKINIDEQYEMRPKVKNPVFSNKKAKKYPIPKGKTPYCLAKRAEYMERDLEKAEKLYRQAVEEGERLESSIKDLATVIHQLGRTQEAIDFLILHRPTYQGDLQKYNNLIGNLSRQVVPSGNCFSRALTLVGIPESFNENDVKALFNNSSRILKIEFKDCVKLTSENVSEEILENKGLHETRVCLIQFASFSAARKTFETIKNAESTKLYWMDIEGYIVEKAELDKIGPGKRPTQNTISSNNTFDTENEFEDGSRSTLASLTEVKADLTPTKLPRRKFSHTSSIILEEQSPMRREEFPKSSFSNNSNSPNNNTQTKGPKPFNSNVATAKSMPNINSGSEPTEKQVSSIFDEIPFAQLPPPSGTCWGTCIYTAYENEQISKELEYSYKDIFSACSNFFQSPEYYQPRPSNTLQMIKIREKKYKEEVESGQIKARFN